MQFALLFWDILFLPLPGVFETPYQTAPLDLATDAFSLLRRSEINARLAELENGNGPEILRRTHEREKVRETWCVGLNWSYAVEDLLEIVEVNVPNIRVDFQCIGPNNLSQICKIFSEEYGHRTGGMPDLCLWKYTVSERRCLFSEVKGPGDRLSETQENWIDFLAGLGGTLEVELCHLKEISEDGKLVPPKKYSNSSADGKPRKGSKSQDTCIIGINVNMRSPREPAWQNVDTNSIN